MISSALKLSDANGSMVRRANASIRYDAERRPVRVSEGPSVLWRASYDGDGARRKRVDGKGTIHYLGGYERNVGNGADTTETVTKYYRALGRLVAFRRNGVLYWVGTDHLGGTVRVANSSFSPIAQMRYMPYGASRDNTDETITDYLFTSQQLDASIGLYWYGSRAYDPELGRFVCADAIVPSAGNPQGLNRYAYTYNNPLKYVDPSGHDPWAGQGIVILEHPDWLPREERDALLEHNTRAADKIMSERSRDRDRSDDGDRSPSRGTTASDGQTLAGQSAEVQKLFNDTYGSDAASQWLQEHNAAISQQVSGSGGGSESDPPILLYADYIPFAERPEFKAMIQKTPPNDDSQLAWRPPSKGRNRALSEGEYRVQQTSLAAATFMAKSVAPIGIEAKTGIDVSVPWAAGAQLVDDKVNKPEMDGWELARRVHQTITITMLTGGIGTALGWTFRARAAFGLSVDVGREVAERATE